jgi:hypothetical protein
MPTRLKAGTVFRAGIIHFPSSSLQFLLRQLTADCLRNSLGPVAGREASFRFLKCETALRAQLCGQNRVLDAVGTKRPIVEMETTHRGIDVEGTPK